MKNRGSLKLFVLVIILVISYYLYKQIIILKSEYIKREEKKQIFLEKIDKTYTERNSEFYKVN
ncbi:hypothetical protein [Cetobacterium sp.]|uniref:hypothetical protein n=1 Tax=Cetobacterium sp. TaxID=2071632 RepID=UPI003F3D7030